MEEEDVVLKEQTKPRGFLDKEKTGMSEEEIRVIIKTMDENPPDLVIRKTYYFISYVGWKMSRRGSEAKNQFFHGMISKHPLDHIVDLNKQNKELKGFNCIFSDFVLISWKEITEDQFQKHESVLAIKTGENEI